MRNFIGVGVAVGLLAGIWTFVSVEVTLLTWVAFVFWALFFAAGGDRAATVRTAAPALAGVGWGWAAGAVYTHLWSSTLGLSVIVAVLALVLCLQAAVDLLSFIPAAFAGTAVYFGTGFDVLGSIVPLVIGVGLGYISAVLASAIQVRVDGPAGAEPVAA